MSLLDRLRKKFPVLVPPSKKAETRVAIAEDVIETLGLRKMRAKRGTYFSEKGDSYLDDPFEAIALRMRQRYGQAECTVCALGAAAISAIGLYNKPGAVGKAWDIFGEVDQSELHKVLGRWFTPIQLDLIECAFETSTAFSVGESTYDARDDAEDFGLKYNTDHNRLVAIMENIIENKGTFRP